MGDTDSIRAPRGNTLSCKGWVQEAALRMIMNNLDSEVAENPSELIVYGGSGKAARNWESFYNIISVLKDLESDETLLVQSGKPVAVFPSHIDAPRVLIANSNLVGNWANWDVFHDLEKKGLIMFGQMTAGSWIYIGTQGILQGTYETFMSAAKKHFYSDLTGRVVLSGGLGGMGGAQPLACVMAGGVFLGVEVNEDRIKKRIHDGYLQTYTHSIDEAIQKVIEAKEKKQPYSIAICGNAATIFQQIYKRNFIPDLVTDQTSAHDLLHGYIPEGLFYPEALTLRQQNPQLYLSKAVQSVGNHVLAMLNFKMAGSHVFDYGNNIRTQAFEKAKIKKAFEIPGFVSEYIRPLFCEGKGPFRWVALSGDPKDIETTDNALIEAFHDNAQLVNWIEKAKKYVHFQGLPARICWLGYGEREKAGVIFNELVKSKKVSAPIVIGRDHLDCGSVASPYRETENMKDGSDAIADWPILNALINAVNGASWVSFHHGGGVGIGYSLHAGMVIVADGTDEAERRLRRVLTSDPGMGVVRHHDAGYDQATQFAKKNKIRIF